MRKQDFYGLPRSIQDRFIESSQGAAAPAPLAVVPLSENASLYWGIGSLVALGLWAGYLAYGFGDLNSSFALSSLPQRLIHCLFAGAALFSALRAYALSWSTGQLQYGPGVYLFPFGVVRASFEEIVEYDGREVTSIAAQGTQVVVHFGATKFAFPLQNAERAEAVLAQAQAGLEKWKKLADSAALERARLSPLVDSGIHNPLAPTEPHSRPRLVSSVVIIALAAVIGIGAGFGVSVWRDSLSQKALFNAAIKANSIDAYRLYIKQGGSRPEVVQLLLPRAELGLAIQASTVEAIEKFRRENPDTQIEGEVQNALRAALLAELEKARQAGTLAALVQIEKKFKDHQLIAGEIAAARRDVYTRAMAEFQKSSSNKEPGLVAFVQALLTYAEKHGPRVQLRARQEFPQDRKMLDQIVSKSKKYYMGQKSLPTQYFLGERARKREELLLVRLRDRLQQAFHPDILRFEIAAPPAAENEELAAADSPAITVMHREKLSGGYVGGKPRAMYMGAAIFMEATATIPGQDALTLSYQFNAWKNPDFSLLSDPKKDMPDVYEDMLGGTYEKFGTEYLERWFAKP